MNVASIEQNSEDWREMRSRVDSIANAVFLVSGGALSLSITVILGNLDSEAISNVAADLVASAWYWLLAAVFLFLLLKFHLVLQAFLLQFHTPFVDRHITAINRIGWLIGISGFVSFMLGLVLMVRGAALAVGAG